jgi:hypothetical protein
MWTGFWQGVGVFAFSVLFWLVWKAAHSRFAHKLEEEHWFHTIGEFFK